MNERQAQSYAKGETPELLLRIRSATDAAQARHITQMTLADAFAAGYRAAGRDAANKSNMNPDKNNVYAG